MTPGDSTHRNCPQGHAIPDQIDQCPVCGKPPAEEATEETRGRSLWDVMGQPKITTPIETVDPDQQQATRETTGEEDTEQSAAGTEVDHDTAETQRPRGLWDVMRQGNEDGPGDAVPELPEADPVELADATRACESEDESDSETAAASAPELSRSCGISLVTGIIAILLAGLGLVPPVIWTSLPALMAGLVAVYTGVVGFSETGSSLGRLRGRGRATIGIGLGTLGMFLPLMLRSLL